MATFIGLIMNSKYQQTLIIYSIFDIFFSELRKYYINLFFKHSAPLFHTLIYSSRSGYKALIKRLFNNQQPYLRLFMLN